MYLFEAEFFVSKAANLSGPSSREVCLFRLNCLMTDTEPAAKSLTCGIKNLSVSQENRLMSEALRANGRRINMFLRQRD